MESYSWRSWWFLESLKIQNTARSSIAAIALTVGGYLLQSDDAQALTKELNGEIQRVLQGEKSKQEDKRKKEFTEREKEEFNTQWCLSQGIDAECIEMFQKVHKIEETWVLDEATIKIYRKIPRDDSDQNQAIQEAHTITHPSTELLDRETLQCDGIREAITEGYDFSSTSGIKDFQRATCLEVDGIAWPKTFQKIITLGLEQIVDPDTRHKVEAYKEMSLYNTKYSRGIPPIWEIPVFRDSYYYGWYGWKNIPGTFIHEDVDILGIPRTLPERKNVIIYDKVSKELDNGNRQTRYVVKMYVAGELEVFSYNAPGRRHKDGGSRTPLGEHRIRWLDKYHTSSAYPKNSKKWAPMPYAINFYSPKFWGHGRDTGPGIYSHGCEWSPLLYQKAMFEKVQKLGIKNVTVNVLAN